MRDLRLRYIINMVSDIASKAKTDERALTMAQRAVQEALKGTNEQIGLMERLLLRVGGVAGRSSDQQAQYLARLAMRYQDVRKAAEGAAKAMQTVAAVGTGATAGAYAVDRMTRAPMDYSLRLAHMANTAYADRDAAGRIAGKRTLNAAVSAAVRTGGGSRDDAAGALDTLIASGAVDVGQAIKLLPMLMRGSTASGATPDQLGGIALRGMQSFGIQLDQVPELLNMAMAAGQAGGFELRDMAKWLPQAMAAGRMSGLSGMEGMRRILASMQAGVIVAGSKDEAGNNLVNLLAKINSQDTATDLKKLGIDLPAVLAKQRSRGVNSLDAFVGMVDGIAQQDAEYVALRKQLAKAGTTGERAEKLQAMADILQGSAIGKVIQDRQAMMGLVAEMNNRRYVDKVMDATRTNTGALGTSFDVVSQEVAANKRLAQSGLDDAAQAVFDKLAPAFNLAAKTVADVTEKYPTLSMVLVGATGAVVAFTAALGASGLIGILTGRAGNAGGVVGRATTLAAGGASMAAGALLKGGSLWWARAAGTVAAPVIGAGLDAYGTFADDTLTDAGKRRGYARAGAGLGGGLSGALGGAAVGSFFGPVGTLVGGIGGGLLGSWGGQEALDWLWKSDPARDVVGPDGQTLPTSGGRIELGQGKLDVNVSVRDDRTSVGLVPQGSPTLQINAGSTNPAGYQGPR